MVRSAECRRKVHKSRNKQRRTQAQHSQKQTKTDEAQTVNCKTVANTQNARLQGWVQVTVRERK